MRSNSDEHNPSQFEAAYLYGTVSEKKKTSILEWAKRQRGVTYATTQIESDGTGVNLAIYVEPLLAREVDEALRNLEGVVSVIFIWRPYFDPNASWIELPAENDMGEEV
jgi:hypothetical protein